LIRANAEFVAPFLPQYATIHTPMNSSSHSPPVTQIPLTTPEKVVPTPKKSQFTWRVLLRETRRSPKSIETDIFPSSVGGAEVGMGSADD
jgi:hypothetical protein